MAANDEVEATVEYTGYIAFNEACLARLGLRRVQGGTYPPGASRHAMLEIWGQERENAPSKGGTGESPEKRVGSVECREQIAMREEHALPVEDDLMFVTEQVHPGHR